MASACLLYMRLDSGKFWEDVKILQCNFKIMQNVQIEGTYKQEGHWD